MPRPQFDCAAAFGKAARAPVMLPFGLQRDPGAGAIAAAATVWHVFCLALHPLVVTEVAMRFRSILACALCLAVCPRVWAQNAQVVAASIEVRPPTLTMDVNGAGRVTAVAYDASGRPTNLPVVFFSSARRSLEVDSTGLVRARRPGEYRIYATVVQADASIRDSAVVTVRWPPLKSVTIVAPQDRLYVGTTTHPRARVTDAAGLARDNVSVQWQSSDHQVLAVSPYGGVTALRPGTATITALAPGVAGTWRVTVAANPARVVTLRASVDHGRTGDVIRFAAEPGTRPARSLPTCPSPIPSGPTWRTRS